MKRMALLCIMLMSLCVSAFAQGKQKVAVYMAGEEPRGALGSHRMVGGELVMELSKSPKYSAIDRTEDILSQLAQEHKFQRSGAVDDAQIKALGRQLGVQFLCIVRISEVRGGFYLEVRLVDVETAEVISPAAAASDLRDMNEMMTVAQYLARELVSGGSGTRYVQKAPQASREEIDARTQEREWEKQQEYQTGGSTQSSSGGGSSSSQRSGGQIAAYVYGIEMAKLGEDFSEKIVNGLVADRKYSAAKRGAREFYRQADREQKKKSELLTDRDFCKIGIDYGVDYLCIIDIEKAGRGQNVWARILDLKTCQIIATAESRALIRNDAEVNAVANELVRELAHRRIGKRSIR